MILFRLIKHQLLRARKQESKKASKQENKQQHSPDRRRLPDRQLEPYNTLTVSNNTNWYTETGVRQSKLAQNILLDRQYIVL